MNKVFNAKSHSKLESPNRYKLIPPSYVLDKMNIKPGDTVLDIGTGTGYFAIPALEKVSPRGKVIGTDISSEMLELFKQKLPEIPNNMELILTEAEKINLPDNVADKILLAFLFHEIHNRTVFIEELKRLIKNEGELTVVDWALVNSEIGPPLPHRIGQNELISIFTQTGFTLLDNVKLNDQHYFIRFCKL